MEFTRQIRDKIIQKGQIVFLDPTALPYESIINARNEYNIESKGGKPWKMWAVDRKTYRGWHRVDGSELGPRDILYGYFLDNKSKIQSSLNNIKSSRQLDAFQDSICQGIIDNASKHIKFVARYCEFWNASIYNRVRKVVDLFIEHIAAMSDGITGQTRQNIVPSLFLPLDSQMIELLRDHEFHNDLKTHFDIPSDFLGGIADAVRGLKYYGDVRSKQHYQLLQEKVKELSNRIGNGFYAIYFDLLWGKPHMRYECWGNNLFETSCGELI